MNKMNQMMIEQMNQMMMEQMNPMMKEQMMIEQMTISPINYLMNMNKTTDQIVMDNPPISFNLMMSDMEKKTNADARPIFYE